MAYKDKYNTVLEKARAYDDAKARMSRAFNTNRCTIGFMNEIFPELKESSDEEIRLEIRNFIWGYPDKLPKRDKWLAWFEKQTHKTVDCPQNHQDVTHPNGGIVMEDFNGGEGFYKLHLDYLNKKQIEEVEEMVRTWNKESKTSDENIKNCIGMCLTDANEQRFKDYGTTLKDCLAWLEKQHIDPYNGVSFEYNGHIWGMCARDNGIEIAMDGKPVRYFSYEDCEQIFGGKSAREAIKEERVDNQNCVKNTDKVEPKFKVGDWIANGGANPCYVKSIFEDYYELCSCEGFEYTKPIIDVNYIYHLWTISDAKDGDVLVDKDNNIGIFEKCYDFDWVSCCSLGNNGGFQYFTVEHENEKTYPTTKEQRDLLFLKMKQEGYEWNSEKN